MRQKTEIISLLLAVFMLFSIAAGCSPSEPKDTATPAPTAASPTPTDAEKAVDKPDSAPKLPIVDEPVTLTAWWSTSNDYIDDPNETLPFKEGSKRTNIYWKFQVPSRGSESEQFNLLLASLQYPDLIKNFGSYYTRGYDYAVSDDVIVPLEGYLDSMPDISRWRNSSEIIRKALTTDSGHLAGIPMFLIGSEDYLPQGAFSGYGVRSDWLSELGISVPQTYDEMAALCQAIKDAGYCQYPFELWPTADTYAVIGGYNIASCMPGYGGTMSGWIVKDGTVTFSLAEQNYFDYIQMLNSWVGAGYIEPDYYTANTYWNNALKKASNNELGVFNYMYTWYELFLDTALDKNMDIAAVSPLRKSTSDTIHVRSSSSGASIAASVTTQCENVELVCAFWNYFFTEDGILLGNYGVENETFEYSDGKPEWNDYYFSLVDEHDASYAQSMCFIYLGPGFRWWDRELGSVNETSVSFLEVWDADDYTDSEYFFPTDATMTGEENTSYATIMSDVGTFISENITRFIIGDQSLDDWDAFVSQVYSMGIDKAASYKQAAYDRYISRK